MCAHPILGEKRDEGFVRLDHALRHQRAAILAAGGLGRRGWRLSADYFGRPEYKIPFKTEKAQLQGLGLSAVLGQSGEIC